jgi:hypothetical protein
MAERIISSVGADRVIFLGDYFDDFHDDLNQVEETCHWFVKSVQQKNRIHLFGNHDVHYAFPYSMMRCSGFADWKYMKINDLVGPATWNQLKFFHVLDNAWLLSHAGLHTSLVPKDAKALRQDREKMFGEIKAFLWEQQLECLRVAANGRGSWMFNAGYSRGGFNKVGGLIWCDYNDEFHPTKGLNQIVGHTPQKGAPVWTLLNEKYKLERREATSPVSELNNPEKSVNLGLDVWGTMHFAVWNGTSIDVRSYAEL